MLEPSSKKDKTVGVSDPAWITLKVAVPLGTISLLANATPARKLSCPAGAGNTKTVDTLESAAWRRIVPLLAVTVIFLGIAVKVVKVLWPNSATSVATSVPSTTNVTGSRIKLTNLTFGVSPTAGNVSVICWTLKAPALPVINKE